MSFSETTLPSASSLAITPAKTSGNERAKTFSRKVSRNMPRASGSRLWCCSSSTSTAPVKRSKLSRARYTPPVSITAPCVLASAATASSTSFVQPVAAARSARRKPRSPDARTNPENFSARSSLRNDCNISRARARSRARWRIANGSSITPPAIVSAGE